MADLYGVRIESITGECLTCRVTELYGEGYDLVASRTLALGFLWDTVEWHWWFNHPPGGRIFVQPAEAQAAAEAAPLGRELAGHQWDDAWNRENARRFIACVGVTGRGEGEYHYIGAPLPQRVPEATYHISVTDGRWLEHLTPGAKWNSRAYDHDRPVICAPAWRTPDVMAVANGIERSQDFSGMPVLADALQEAGCGSDDLLNHLRDGSAAHVRGCWALDLVLGKE